MITFIPTPIGNPEDITLRAMRAFEAADLFLCEDTRETKKLLHLLHERYGMQLPDAEYLSFHEHNGAQRIAELGEVLGERNVVFVSDAGTPAISDPGQLLVAYAQRERIAYDVLPGASAATTAYAASGLASGHFLFFGFLPPKGSARQRALEEALTCGYDAILYEAPHRLEKLFDALVEIDPDRELFAAKEMTKRHQTYYRGTAHSVRTQIVSERIRGEWVVILRAQPQQEKTLSIATVMRMNMPPKIKAKLLAQMSDVGVKEWYEKLKIKN